MSTEETSNQGSADQAASRAAAEAGGPGLSSPKTRSARRELQSGVKRRIGLIGRVVRESEELARVAHVVRLGARNIYRSQIPRIAAALAYRTIFAVVPIVAISLIIFGSFVSENQLTAGITRVLDYTGLDQIAVRDVPVGVPGDGVGPLPVDVEWPSVQDAGVDALIRQLVLQVNDSLDRVPKASIAIISILILIYAAVSMLVEVEKAFNSVYRAPSGRPWVRRMVLYWTILTLGAILLAATFAVGDILSEAITNWLGDGGGLVAFPVTVAISTIMLAVAYLTVPNSRVHLRPALAGAVVAAVLWELGKWAFRSYIEFSTGYARFYGSLALLPLFLLWIYITWIIVLFGIQVAYTLQHVSEWDDPDEAARGPRVVDPMRALVVAAVVARRFASGLMTGPADCSTPARITDRVAEDMLIHLQRAGVIDRVERGEVEGYTLARPADQIRATELLDAVRQWRVEDEPGGPLTTAAEASRTALEGKTLADLARTLGMGETAR